MENLKNNLEQVNDSKWSTATTTVYGTMCFTPKENEEPKFGMKTLEIWGKYQTDKLIKESEKEKDEIKSKDKLQSAVNKALKEVNNILLAEKLDPDIIGCYNYYSQSTKDECFKIDQAVSEKLIELIDLKNEIKTRLYDCENSEQANKILHAYNIIDENGKILK